MAIYLDAKIIADSVSNLSGTEVSSSNFFAYLILRRIMVNHLEANGTIKLTGKNVKDDIDEAALIGQGNPQYFNPLDSKNPYNSPKWWSNGPTDNIKNWPTKTTLISRVRGEKNVTIKVNPFNENEIKNYLKINNDRKPKISDVAIWWFRNKDLSNLLVNNNINIRNIVTAFQKHLNLDEKECEILFDYDKNTDKTLNCTNTIATPSLYLPKEDKPTAHILRENTDIIYLTSIKADYPYNRIIFGAPGTGKSWQLNTDKDDLLKNGGEYERVTFHPDYTYSQFVGAYKPTTDENGEISYQFVPGPFMRVYVNALKNGRTDYPQPYLLIIEEINRARVASVFGDIFQLLDRKEDGTSQYAIQASEDIKKYLAAELGGQPSDYPILKLPNNMFIWASMNSADQGVYPMDTAFKRRWDFEYLGIDDNQDKIKCTVDLVKGKPESNVSWNRLRKAINAKLLDVCRVNEDKLLGPFFLSKKAIKADESGCIIDEDAFRKAFKSKVIMYLFEDAARQYRSKLFKTDICKMYSLICKEFDRNGMAIFGDDFRTAYYDQQKD